MFLNAGLTGVYYSSTDWGDYNNDGNLDILLAGNTQVPGEIRISKIYKNNGNGTFTDINAGLSGLAKVPFRGTKRSDLTTEGVFRGKGK